MESYIVRIYSRSVGSGKGFAGTVEQIGCEKINSFSNLDELGRILQTERIGLGGHDRDTSKGLDNYAE